MDSVAEAIIKGVVCQDEEELLLQCSEHVLIRPICSFLPDTQSECVCVCVGQSED